MKYVVLLLALFACTPRERKPPTQLPDQFLYWCKQEGRWPVYDTVPDCENVSSGTWAQLPITINAEPELVEEVLDAIQATNAQFGFELFRYDHSNYAPDVAVVTAGGHPWAAADAGHLTVDGRHRGVVRVYNGLELADRADIMVHELGHILGLRHDEHSRMSIMYPGPTTRVALFEPADIKAIRERYLVHP